MDQELLVEQLSSSSFPRLQWLESRPGAPREEGKGTLICAAAAGQADEVGRAEHGGKWQLRAVEDLTPLALLGICH